MMTIDQLYARAMCAGHAYYQIYGCYPEKIGIHHQYYPEFSQRYALLFFVEPPTMTPHLFTEQEMDFSHPFTDIYRTMIVSIGGAAINPDEAYFPVPGNPLHARTAGAIILMAKRLAQELDTEHREALQNFSFTPQRDPILDHRQYL